jgi:hypothetical protein
VLDPNRVLRAKASASRSLLSALTPKQLKIELDPWHLRCIYGPRQWGKTTWSAVAHERASLPGVTNLALASSVHKAQDLLWPAFERLNREHGTAIKLRQGKALFANGGELKLLGLSTLAEAEKIRGYTPGFVSLEEAGTVRDELLEFALSSCARPALMRHFRRGGRGTAVLGTPSRNMGTYWHRMCLGETGASVHFATIHDNPYIDGEANLRQVLIDNARLGWTESTPEYRREYKGEFCSDEDSLPLGRWNGEVLPQRLAPEEGWTVLTLDFGQVHSNAWMVHRLTTEHAYDVVRKRQVSMHKIHLIHAYKENKMTTEGVAARTHALREQFHPNVIRGDSGGGGAQSIADMQRLYNVPIQAAHKSSKKGAKRDKIWFYDSLLGNQTIQVYEQAAPWQKEARTCPWDDEREDFHPRYDHHALDAGLYALEDLTAHMTEEDSEPMPGTAEYEKLSSDRRWAERLEYLQGES